MKDNNEYPEKAVKTPEQFTQLPWYEQIKYIPVAGALCSNGFQELTDKQLETYKNSKVTAAIRYKLQPTNNDYAVKEIQLVSDIKERIYDLQMMQIQAGDDYEFCLQKEYAIKELNRLLTPNN